MEDPTGDGLFVRLWRKYTRQSYMSQRDFELACDELMRIVLINTKSGIPRCGCMWHSGPILCQHLENQKKCVEYGR